MEWVNFAGLVCGFVGAAVTAYGVIEGAAEGLVSSGRRWLGLPPAAASAEELRRASIHQAVHDMSYAVAGLVLIAVGFVLQAIAIWPG